MTVVLPKAIIIALFIGMANSVAIFGVACLLGFLLWRVNRKLERQLAVVVLVMAMLTLCGVAVAALNGIGLSV
jgi:CHASE2 domain-containing sensor protein